MCGIAGAAGSFSEPMLRAAGTQLAHRGPDGSGIYQSGDGIGLVHRRLSIIDLSPQGAQPMTSPDGRVVITYNGEIYNYRELREDLVSAGVRFRGSSDTEVLLHLYLALGEGMLFRLKGIFAFGLWDGQDQSLFIARDALGVKPLYYAQTHRGFAFASEIKALLCLVPEARTLDPEALHRYMTFLYCPGEGTPLREVRKLLPGEAMRVRNGRIDRRWAWYQLPQCAGAPGPMEETEALRGTADHLRRAVHRQLVADVPVGSFLSGGLDSSSIVAFAREMVPAIRCFTIESPGAQDSGFADDLPYARQVARHLGVPLDVVTVDASRMAGDIEQMIWQLDEPLADAAPLNVLYISRLARQQGIKVLLSGAGGDDLFTGYRRHFAWRYRSWWHWLPRPVRAALDRATVGLDQRWALGRRLSRLFAGAGLEGDAYLVQAFKWMRADEITELYSPTFQASVGTSQPAEPMLDFLRFLPPGTSSMDRMLSLEQRFFLPDHNLTYTDKMSMAAGVEVRVPFLDTELVDFAARVPDRFKQRGTVGKWILKRAMEPYLPRDVIYRPKTGFGAPLRRWMRGELRPLLADFLSDASLRRRGLFDPAAVARLRSRNDAGLVDGANTLLAVVSIEIWCRQFLDHNPTPAAEAVAVAPTGGAEGLL